MEVIFKGDTIKDVVTQVKAFLKKIEEAPEAPEPEAIPMPPAGHARLPNQAGRVTVSDSQIYRLWAIAKDKKLAPAEVFREIKARFGEIEINQLNQVQYKAFCDWMLSEPNR